MIVLDRTIQTEDEDELETLSPTEQTYRGFYVAFAAFNSLLFGNKLPDVLITMQRKNGSRGYFASERFGHRHGGTGTLDEIALNPATFHTRTDREIISTLVHEMVHLWQFHFGKPGRRGYHNREWAAKMCELGLMPSRTGEPGGKQTGQRVTHYIIEGGSYDTEWRLLAGFGFRLEYQDRFVAPREQPCKSKACYVCPVCSIQVWGKPEIHVDCHDCGEIMRLVNSGPNTNATG